MHQSEVRPAPMISLATLRNLAFSLLLCVFFARGLSASPQFREIGPAPVPPAEARQQIRTILRKLDPGNRQDTVNAVLNLAKWYRDILDEELIAAWRGDARANLPEAIEQLADPRVAEAIVEFSWREQRQATFRLPYAHMLGYLMGHYAGSSKPFLDDLLASTASGGRPIELSQTEAEAVCRILFDMPDLRDWRKNALQILPHYRQSAESLANQDLHGDDREKMYQASRWLQDLGAGSPTRSSNTGALQRRDPPPPTLTRQPTPRVSASTGTGAGGSDSSYRGVSGVSAAKPIAQAGVTLSKLAVKLRVQGKVVVRFLVLPDGTTQDFKVVAPFGYGVDQSVIESLRNWQFQPGMKDGKAIPTMFSVEEGLRVGRNVEPNTWYSGPMAFKVDSGITQPEVRDGVLPSPGKEMSEESAVFEFTVGVDGSVKGVRLIYGSPAASDLLGRYLAAWSFRPATAGGRFVEVTGRVRFIKGKGDAAVNGSLFDE